MTEISERPRAIIFDIDGVLCDSSKRIAKYADIEALNRGDYNAWRASMARYNATTEEDEVIPSGLRLYRALQIGMFPARFFFVTSRGEDGREPTLIWLQDFINPAICSEDLIMRPAYVERSPGIYWLPGEPKFDHVVYKRAVLTELRKKYNVILALDDYPDLASMYQEEGVPALHVQWPSVDCISGAGMVELAAK